MERYQHLALEIKRIHKATKVSVIPIVIGALETILKSAKASYERLSLLDIFGSALQLAILGIVLLISCGTCCVSKLREAAETWLRIPRK